MGASKIRTLPPVQFLLAYYEGFTFKLRIIKFHKIPSSFMMNAPFLKISLIIFIFLALLISLFPPFEFGNAKLRTLKEREKYSDIVEKLPVKKYDFFFNENKKKIILNYYTHRKKFYGLDTFENYKNLYNDCEYTHIRTSVDSFFIKKRTLFPEIWTRRDKKNMKKTRSLFRDIFYSIEFPKDDDKIVNPNHGETNRDALNYDEVKIEYNKSPKDWNYKYVNVFDSSKKFDEYDITQLVYYLLDRNLIWSELLVEYILAVLISMISGYLIQRFVPRRIFKNYHKTTIFSK